jgi:hypothetical protein
MLLLIGGSDASHQAASANWCAAGARWGYLGMRARTFDIGPTGHCEQANRRSGRWTIKICADLTAVPDLMPERVLGHQRRLGSAATLQADEMRAAVWRSIIASRGSLKRGRCSEADDALRRCNGTATRRRSVWRRLEH